MIVGVTREISPSERRVALTPASIPGLIKAGWEVLVEAGSGAAAGFVDSAFTEKGARIASGAEEVVSAADAIVVARGVEAASSGVRPRWRRDQLLVGLLDPLGSPRLAQRLADEHVTAFALELLPRITRAQSMDALSSMATVAGYKAVLLAATALPRLFPMLMTAAGTVTPARVLVLGAGVAGLQALATARRLGAVASAYDVRPAVRQEVESLGARFIELPLESGETKESGGYAKAQDEAFYQRQRELLAEFIAAHDVVIATAAVPGRRSPLLVTREAVARMAPGSVIVDLAAERGGNCELSRPDETVVETGVTILAPTNLPSSVPYHASQMLGRNIAAFLGHLTRERSLRLDFDDQITHETLVAREGKVVHPRVRELLAGS